MQERTQEPTVAIARILTVEKVSGKGVFMDVELLHYSDQRGDPYEGRVRLCTPYHGVGYGSWHVPDVGTPVLCVFPGPSGPHHTAGGDLDEGYALAFTSFSGEPPVDGLQGALSANRRVYKGRPGTDHDQHLQGKLDVTVDGAVVRLYKGTHGVTTDGNETRESKGTFDWTWRGVAQLFGDLVVHLKSLTNLILHGTVKVTITSDTLIELIAPTISLIADNVWGGAQAAAEKLMNETAMAKFNGHTHPGIQSGASSTGTPNQQMAVDTETTTKMKAV